MQIKSIIFLLKTFLMFNFVVGFSFLNVTGITISVFFFGIALFVGYLGYFSDYLIKGLSISDGNAAIIASMAGAGGFIMAFPRN